MRRLIRKFAVWLRDYTDHWAVPAHVWDAVDTGEPEYAHLLLSNQLALWGYDPEIAYAMGLLDFLDSREES